MGYRCDVGLVVTDKARERLLDQEITREFLDNADLTKEHCDGVMYIWESIRLDGMEDELISVLEDDDELHDQYVMYIIGDDLEDLTVEGALYPNPFNLGISRSLVYDGDGTKEVSPQSLKEVNSNPKSQFCIACGNRLKEPYPGIKFCPDCED